MGQPPRYRVAFFDPDFRTLRIFYDYTELSDAERDAEMLQRAFPDRKVIVEALN